MALTGAATALRPQKSSIDPRLPVELSVLIFPGMKARLRKLIVRGWRPLTLIISGILLASIFNANAAADNALRCGSAIVSLGAARRQVVDTCGPPKRVETWETSRNQYVRQFFDYENERFILPKLIVGSIQMERWTYDFGSNKFIRYLHFLNGELIKIETGDRGGD